jgi:hypothetical protein
MFYRRLSKNSSIKNDFSILGFVLTSLFILSLHAINLTADTPHFFASQDIGLRVDEGYKTLSPRNLVLFGVDNLSEADEYPGWFHGSPLTQSLQYLSFSVAGPSILVARSTALLYFFALVFFVLWSERFYVDNRFLIIIATLLATEPFLFFFSRVALFELTLALFVTSALLTVRRINPERYWFAFTIFLIYTVLAFKLIKISALLYFLPALGIFVLHGLCKYNARIAVIVSVVSVAGIGLMLFVSQDIWSRRIVIPSVSYFIQNFLTNPFVRESPWLTSVTYFCIFDLIVKRGRDLFKDTYFRSLLATVVGVPALLCFFSYAPPRYFVAMVPAYILMVAYWLHYFQRDSITQKNGYWLNILNFFFLTTAFFVFSWTVINFLYTFLPLPQGLDPGLSTPGAIKYLLPAIASMVGIILVIPFFNRIFSSMRTPIVFTTIAMSIISGIYSTSSVWFEPRYDARKVRENLVASVPDTSVVMGDFAPFFALGTHLPAIYSTVELNNGAAIFQLCPDYYINSGTRGDIVALQSYRSIGTQFETPTCLGEYAGYPIMLHAILYPEGECLMPTNGK